jgi:hypothetical protein
MGDEFVIAEARLPQIRSGLGGLITHEEFGQHRAMAVQLFRLSPYIHSGLTFANASRCLRALAYIDDTHPTDTHWIEPRRMAQHRNFDSHRPRGFENRLSRFRFKIDPVDS